MTTFPLGSWTGGRVPFPKEGKPPFNSPIGKKSMPRARKMLAVPWAAPGSGLGMMQ